MNVSSSCSPVFRKKGQWRKELDLIGEWMFQEELANTETFELIFEGWIQVCWGKIGRRVIPRVKAWPHCSRQDIHWEGSSISWAPQGLVGAGQMRSVWQLYHTSTPPSTSFSSFILRLGLITKAHLSTSLENFLPTNSFSDYFFKESITYNIMNATTWYLK